MKSKNGFTLVEIMIVVAIIGILAAIAVPNFLLARERSLHPNRFDKNGQRVEKGFKNNSAKEEIETVNSPIVNENDTQSITMGKFTYNGHTILRFNGRENREWGMHDPDCAKCKK